MTALEQTSETVVAAPEAIAPGRLVWDLPVRIFHWGLVAAFISAFVTNKLGVRYFKYHIWSGYAVLILASFRVVWGFVGTRHALFLNFLRGPREILAYARNLFAANGSHYAGHNPAGALMVLALLAGAATQAALGLFANDEIFNVGPLYGLVTKEFSLVLTSLHRRLFYVLLGAIALHVLAVIAHRIFKGEDLVAAMVTGRKADAASDEAIASSRLWLAAPIAGGVIALLYWIIATAPPAALDGDY